MLLFAMSVSIDGYIADRNGSFAWTTPSDELFTFHLERVSSLGAYLCGRRLYEAMLGWETDPAMRSSPLLSQFAEVWTALPKIVFSRTLDRVDGTAQLATAPVAEEIATVLSATERDVEIGGATLAATAFEQGLIDELRIFRVPIVVGGGTPYLPPVPADVRFDLIETRTFDPQIVYERYRRQDT